MNYAGSQKVDENVDHVVLFRTRGSVVPFRNLVSIDTLSVWGLAYVHNQQRNIPGRKRTSRFSPGECSCFPSKIASSSVGDVLRVSSHILEDLEHSLVKVASRERQISRLSLGSGYPMASMLGEEDLRQRGC